ncbi:hypothetical protein FOC4_g10001718, partial [Fusarium odoratissimum]
LVKMDPTMHTVDPENEGILELQNEVINIRSMLSGPLKRDCPIVLVPGFSGWGRPLLGTVNYFGGFENLPLILSQLGYVVIVVRIGPISTNRERAPWQDLLPPRGLNPLIDFITSCSYESRQDRIYDLHLDHWGFSRNPGETYSQMRARIAPDITTWWTGLHNGLYDNSISGIGNLNAFAPTPSPNIYYFTMSFCATRPFPKDTLTTQDINGFLALFPLNQVWNPLGVWGRVAAPFQPLGTRLGVLPSLYAALTWITDVANRHLQIMQYFSQIPRPGSQIPRQDMLPLIMYPAYAMGGRGTTLPGITLQEFQHNDGIVNTRSMDGPSTGPVNHGSFTARLAAAAPANLKGIYWNLGANATIDHADQIGVFTDPDTVRLLIH